MPYKSAQSNHVIRHIIEEYGAEPEFLWPERYPDYCIFRHHGNRKWFGIIMVVPGNKMGLDTAEAVEIIDLKTDANQALEFAKNIPGIFPGYHMNKMNWISIVLDNTLPDEMVFDLIKKSYLITDKKQKRARRSASDIDVSGGQN